MSNKLNGTAPEAAEAADAAVEDLTALAAKAISEAVSPLLKDHDPRALVRGLLMNGVRLSQQIIQAQRWSQVDVAAEFSQAMLAAIDAQPEQSRILVADATGRTRRQ